jgi:hypothetical protein
VVGAAVEVTAVDYEGDERRGLLALCRRDGATHRIPLLDVIPAGPLSLATARLVAAYRQWWGAAPQTVPPSQPDTPAWRYEALAPRIEIEPPLALIGHGDWDPEDEYWGEPGDPLHPI